MLPSLSGKSKTKPLLLALSFVVCFTVMFTARKYLNKAIVASVAVSTTRTPSAACQDQVWSTKGLGLPNFKTITPSLLDSAVNKEIDVFKDSVSKIKTDFPKLSVQNPTKVVDELEKIAMPVTKDYGLVKHLMGVNNNEQIRDVQKVLQSKVVASMQGIIYSIHYMHYSI